MNDLPGYVWLIAIAGVAAIAGSTCVVLYGGARRAGQDRAHATLLAGAAAVLFGGWLTVSAMIAGRGDYDTPIGHGVPWMPVAFAGFLGTLLALTRIPAVARALRAPGMASGLLRPHTFRVAGAAFLLAMALGRLPALFALPAGLGDIAVGITAPFTARRLADGTGRSPALWFSALGITDLVAALSLGALTSYQLISVTPSSVAISELPLALIPTVGVPLLLSLHLSSVLALVRSARAGRQDAGRPDALTQAA
jgi:hypothetical protein